MSKITNGCRIRIQLSCVKEKKREGANRCKDPGASPIPFSASWPRLEGTAFLMSEGNCFPISEKHPHPSSLAGAGKVIRFV